MGFFNWGTMGNDGAVKVMVALLKICGKTFQHDGLINEHGFSTIQQTTRCGQQNHFSHRFKLELYSELHQVLGSLMPSDVEPNYPRLLDYASNDNPDFFLFEILELTPMVNTSECVGNKYQVLAHIIMGSGARCPKALMKALIASFSGDIQLRHGSYQGLKEQRLFALKSWYKKNMKKKKEGLRWQFEEGWPHQTFIDDYHKPIGLFPPGMIKSVVKRDKVNAAIASGKGWIDKIVSKKPKFFANPPNDSTSNARNRLTQQEIEKFKKAHEEEFEKNNTSPPLEQRAHLLAITAFQLKKTDRSCTKCLKKNDKKLLMCSGCKSVFYCSIDCQRTHWKAEHKKMCKIVKKMRDEINVKGSIYSKKKKGASAKVPKQVNVKKEDK